MPFPQKLRGLLRFRMTLIPAIDLLDGSCVRLLRGNYELKTQYQNSPGEMARYFESSGVRRIHVVDLNAAKGETNNRSVISDIRAVFSGIIEVGGGIRKDEDVKGLINCGIDRLIVGTLLLKEPEKVRRWREKWGSHFIAGIDALNGEVRTDGWIVGKGVLDSDLASKLNGFGLSALIYTNIDRDGTLKGPDIEKTVEIARISQLPTIVSGGVSGMDDLEKIASSAHQGIEGVIVGKALYEGRVDLEKALDLFPGDGRW